MNKKGKAYICVSAIIVVVIIFGILYVKTDILKTKEQLFWKYMSQKTDEIANILSNDETQRYNDILKKSSYIKEGNISIASRLKLIKPINIKLSERGNNIDDCKNIFVELEYDNNDVGNTTFIKDDNYILIKNDFINSNYIGFKNENLKELAETIGIINTDYIPDKIGEIDYIELFSVSDSEINHFSEKYVPICRRYINNKDYIKKENIKSEEKEDNITSYEVRISEKQLNELIIDVLEELYEDKESLQFLSNKIEILNNEKQYSNIDYIKNKISKLIEYFENKEANAKNILSIIIYVKEKNVIKIELVLKDERTISIETEDKNKIIIKQYDVKDKDVNIETTAGIIKTVLNGITKITYTKSILNNTTNKVDMDINCNIGLESITLNYNYVKQIKNNVENIIHKDEVEYIDLKSLDAQTYKMMLQKLLKISRFEAGKNYQKKI